MSDTSAVERKLAEELGFRVHPMHSCNGHILSPQGDHIGQADWEHVALWRALVARETERRWIPVSQESARELSRKSVRETSPNDPLFIEPLNGEAKPEAPAPHCAICSGPHTTDSHGVDSQGVHPWNRGGPAPAPSEPRQCSWTNGEIASYVLSFRTGFPDREIKGLSLNAALERIAEKISGLKSSPAPAKPSLEEEARDWMKANHMESLHPSLDAKRLAAFYRYMEKKI